MGWFGPNGTCGCCAPCVCLDDPEQSGRDFSGTPTVKVVVTGLPSTISFSYVRVRNSPFEFVNTITIVTLDGLDALNGTYFFEMQKTESNCLINDPQNETFSIDVTVDTYTVGPGASPCTPSLAISNTFGSNATVNGNAFQARVDFPGASNYSARGDQDVTCQDNYIPIIGDDDENNGDIILDVLANDATDCDTRFRASVIDFRALSVIGNVTYEMLNL
jgi:hypothetical protein